MADEDSSTNSGLIPDDDTRGLLLPPAMIRRGLELAKRIERQQGVEAYQYPISEPVATPKKNGATSRVSVASDSIQGNGASGQTLSMSGDGRFVAFQSRANNLTEGDTKGVSHIFVHDRQKGQTTYVSVASDGKLGNRNSYFPSISASGRYVAFVSRANNLVSSLTNGFFDVFLHDRKTGETTLISVSSGGMQGYGMSRSPSISANGRYVAFESSGNHLENDINRLLAFCVHDRKTGETTGVYFSSDGTQHYGSSGQRPSISGDGRYVAFVFKGSNLATGRKRGNDHIFVLDRQKGETTRVSVASDGTHANGGSWHPSISACGRHVAFESGANNLVRSDTNGFWDVFVHDRKIGETTCVSVSSRGTRGNGTSGRPSISGDGRYVAFWSEANNLVSSDTNGFSDVFVHDRKIGETICVSVSSDGTQANGRSHTVAISADGQIVAFGSDASNLVEGDTNGVRDVFVHDRREKQQL